MKVKQLIAFLEDLPEDSDVLIAIDEEGNGFNQMFGAHPGLYEPGSPNDYMSPEWTYEDAGYDSEEEWEARKAGMTPCVVLWP